MKNVYLPVILWLLHQILGTAKGDRVYAQLGPLITAELAAQAGA